MQNSRKKTEKATTTAYNIQKKKQERQHAKLRELLAKPDTHLDGVTEQWWDEFEIFLKTNRFNLR